MYPKVLYVVHPFTAHSVLDYMTNTLKAIVIAKKVYEAGHLPIVPHSLTIGWGSDLAWQKAMQYCTAILRRCDGVVGPGPAGEYSPGVTMELALAKKLDMPIWENPSDLPKSNDAAEHPIDWRSLAVEMARSILHGGAERAGALATKALDNI